ncbi:MAG: hypothetical protein A2X64_11180 [Ignavibacteria bacterium GWF2_33_9]|nr:MAG: hypothetical protein A2X64_11180 [Ignavibacteria bacterium GWF2_33_9]
MSKKKVIVKSKQSTSNGEFNENQIPDFLQKNWIYFIALFVLVFIFFGQGIFGNGFNSSDTVASMSFDNYLKAAKDSGNFPQWIPYIFSGMPSFASLLVTGQRLWDFLGVFYFQIFEQLGLLLGGDEARVALHYVMFAIGMFLLMREKKQNHLIAFFTSVAAVFSTGIVIWIMIGHFTKPVVFSMYPWIFLFMEKLLKKFSFLWAALFVLAVHIMLEATHVQMIFYGGLMFGLYLLYEFFVRLLKKENFLAVLKPGITLVAAFGISFLLSADRYLSIQEYTPYSTRGSAPMMLSDQQHQTKDGGNDYQYATMWSFSPGETITFLVPSYYGFGKLKYIGPETNNTETLIPTYWGQKPFEDAAPYFGIFIFFFAIIGAYSFRKDVFVQFLIFVSIIALILSFGNTFPVLYNFFYYNFPFFNKFRAPSMVLAIIHFTMPILAGYGIATFIKWNKGDVSIAKKKSLYFLFGSGLFLLIGIIFIGTFQNSYFDALKSSQSFRLPESFYGFVWDAMVSDWIVNAIILIISAGLVYFFVTKKLKFNAFIFAIILLAIFDLWRVGWRPMDIPEQKLSENVFVQDDAIDFVKQDNSVYRVADFASQSPNAAAYYGLQNVNGYQSAKLRLYQDMLDATSQGSTSNLNSPFMWNLLNVKYILAKQDMGIQPVYKSNVTGTMVYLNPSYLPRAFFVDTLVKEEPKTILNHLAKGDFNPTTTAFIEKDVNLKVTHMDLSASAKVTNFQNEYISFNVNTKTEKMLVVSEVYYPDWYAFLDGKEVDVYKVDFLLRGVMIPSGNHKLEFKYISKSFATGKILSLSSNIFLTFLLILSIFIEIKKKKTKNPAIQEIKSE